MEAFYLRPQVTVPSSYDACAKISDYEMFKEYLLVTGEWAFKLDATTSVMPEADALTYQMNISCYRNLFLVSYMIVPSPFPV